MIPNRIPLKERPKKGEHAEGDLFVSPIRSGAKKSGAIVCVPSAQLLAEHLLKIADRLRWQARCEKLQPY